MPRHNKAQAPRDYNCPYKHSCPHLLDLSAHWVLSQYKRSYEEHREHWRVRDAFEETVRKAKLTIQQLLGKNFDGVMITDGYAAYNGINPVARQSCLVHLIRKAKEIKKQILLCEKKHQNQKAITFCDDIKELFKDACEIGQKIKNNNDEQKKAPKYKKNLQRRLKKICNPRLSDKGAKSFQKRLTDPKKELNRLFVFLDYPGIDPTNNHAERALRKLVIFRKICFGTRSELGSYCHSVLPSLIATANRQGKHPIGFLQTLFAQNPATTQQQLYNDSS